VVDVLDPQPVTLALARITVIAAETVG